MERGDAAIKSHVVNGPGHQNNNRTLPSPREHILVSGAYEYSMLYNKRELKLQKIKIANQLTLKQDHLDNQDEPCEITGVF